MNDRHENFDIVIVGGAMVGAMIAYFLKQEGFDGSIAIVERFTGSARKTTGFFMGGLRQQFSNIVNIRLARFSAEFYRGFEERLGVSSGFDEHGFLLLYAPEDVSQLHINYALQQAEGVDVIVEEPDELLRRYPWLNVEGVAAGSTGLSGEGSFDAWRVLTTIRKINRQNGVQEIRDEIVRIAIENDRISEVHLASGLRLDCTAMINAADPHSTAIAALAGVCVPVETRKRQMFRFSRPQKIGVLPMVIDISGVYVRPDRHALSCGKIAAPFDENIATENDFQPDTWMFADIMRPIIAHRIPLCSEIRLSRASVIHYDYNPFDQNPIVGPHDRIENFLFLCGISGRALGLAPALARALAEYVVHGGYQTVDCSPFAFSRFADNQPSWELNLS
jgi:FAD-dependent oxidoreductase domain-containing protein 1